MIIKGAKAIVEKNNELLLLEPAFIGIEGDSISYVGTSPPEDYEAPVIDVPDGLILPGFVDIHYHADSPLTKGFIEDVGSPNIDGSILYEHLPAIYASTTIEEWIPLARLTIAEMIRNGITTCVEFNSYFPEELASILTEMGLRGYIAPETNSLKGCPYSLDGKIVIIEEIDNVHLFDKLNKNLELIDKLNGTNNNLIRVTLGLTEPPACNPEILREVRKFADKLKVPITMHAAETKFEKQYIRERYNRTSIEYLDENGITGEDVILGHAVFTTESDRDILTKTRTSVAHCPTVFARVGQALHSLHQYLMRGINVGIGTDTFPQDMIHEMRNATVLSKIMDEDFLSATSLDVFKCATVNGAKALGRDDIGRIRIGAKADIIVVKLDDLNLVPIRDPLKVLVNCGNGHNVTTTIVNGKVLMHGKKLIACEEDIVHEAQAAAKRVWKQSRVLDKLSPISLKTWQQK